jgi:hypothetical protein
MEEQIQQTILNESVISSSKGMAWCGVSVLKLQEECLVPGLHLRSKGKTLWKVFI